MESIVDEEEHAGKTMRTAMEISLTATMNWSQRYSEAAKKSAASVKRGQRLRLLTMIHSACAQVPRHPARNLHEALQSLIVTHCALVLEGQGTSLSIGRLDKMLERFHDEVRDNEERAIELKQH